MRVPQVNERVQEAPAGTLRAMFAGIGRLLNITDKIRNKPAGAETPGEVEPTAAGSEASGTENTAAESAATVAAPAPAVTDATPETMAPAPAAGSEPVAAATEAKTRARKPRKTAAKSEPAAEAGGHVKLLPAEDEAAAGPVAAAPAEAATPQAVVPETVVPETVVPETVAPEAVVPEEPAAAAAAELPLANYDTLTVASLRARMRNLSVAQLGELVVYEKAHAGRADVISMFERRIVKVQAES
ncbi:MAG TPA: hypothetical protein VH372_12410 [Actinospica sp.]|nr:hypothetical protein [Actinospica sp.]